MAGNDRTRGSRRSRDHRRSRQRRRRHERYDWFGQSCCGRPRDHGRLHVQCVTQRCDDVGRDRHRQWAGRLHDSRLSLTVNVPAVVAKLIPGGSDSPEVINAVLSGGTVYLEVPSLASRIGAPWISVALPSKASSAVPVLFTKIATALGDVNAIVRFADAHHATVTSLGNAMVDGVQASGTKIVATRSTRSLTASVWADASDRLVQATVAVTATGTRGTHGLTATVDFAGYGSPVTIVVPQPSQVKAIPFSMVKMFLGRAR